MANHSGAKCALMSNTIMYLYWFILVINLVFAGALPCQVYAANNVQIKDQPDICDTTPDEKLPVLEQLKILAQCANSGNCDSAVYLANFLQKYSMTDFEGRDDRYWYKVGARCGDAWSMIEIGYPKYTTLTEVPCGDHRLEIKTYCDPLKKENEFPVCRKHIFSFYGKDNRLLRRRVAINRFERYEYRVIVGSVTCMSSGNNFYYVAAATNYGVSCCEWFDIFDMTGKYIGTLNDRSSFGVKLKKLPKHFANEVFEYIARYQNKNIDINEYPKWER